MIFNIKPMAKPRMTRSDKWKKRPCVVRYRAFCDEIRLQAKQKGFTYPDSMAIEFRVEMPKSWSKKKKETYNGTPHHTRPDVDNLCKAVLDALYEEDSHIWCLGLMKTWATKSEIEICTI